MTAVPATLRLRREGALRSRAARGDAAAFAAVYERHHQALYRYCRSILRHEEDAQDALQSTMARAFAALQNEQRDFELRPWLFRIAHNEAISILRRRPATTELGDLPGDEGETEDRVATREELRVLRHDLADLPERQRAALVLRELNGLGHAEIGEVLDLSPAGVKQAIFEARAALFNCREGREMGCHDVRRMLSDGDGRVLRGRGVRAHLRSCPDCRSFRDDLQRRPAALRMLAPPLPVAGAATLLAQLLGGSTAKLLACVAIAGGGTTLAVELNDTPKPSPPPTGAAVSRPRAEAPKPAVRVVGVATSVPQETAPARPASVEKDRSARKRTPNTRRPARGRRTPDPAAASPQLAAAAAPAAKADKSAKANKPPKAKKPAKADKPAKTKSAKPPKPPKPPKPKPAKRETQPVAPAAVPSPPAAEKTPPGYAKKQASGADESGGDDVSRGRGNDEDD